MGSFRSVCALGLTVVAGAVLTGCGSEVVAAPEQPVATPPEQQNYSGLTVYSLADAGFSIGVPTGWTAMTAADAYGASVDAIVADDPRLGAFRDLFSSPDSPFKLVALEYDPEACICSRINVLAFSRNDAWDPQEFEAGALEGTRKLALSGTKPRVKRVTTPAGAGIRITTRTKLPGTGTRVIATQYYIQTRSSAYILSYTATPDVTKSYGRLFERSARSLREV